MGIEIHTAGEGKQEEQLLLDIAPAEIRVDGRYINLTKEQIELFEKLTALQQRFALNILKGHTNRHSYKAAGGKAKTENAVDAGASEILSHPRVRNFMIAMSVSRISSSIMSKEEMLETLTVKARAGKANVYDFVEISSEDQADDCPVRRLKSPEEIPQKYHAAATGIRNTKSGPEVILDNGLAAMKLISDLNGYNAAVKSEINGSVDLTNSQQKILDKSLDEEY